MTTRPTAADPRHVPGNFLYALAVACCLLALLVHRPAFAATVRWTGLGDGIQWNNPANWEGGSAPGPADHAVLDHSLVAGSYTVQLPTGSGTTTVRGLRIEPTLPATIMLVLPSGNTANPGLKAGDAIAGTDDIVLVDGATLRNESGASYGNGVEASSVANGTVRIDNGARYVHATMRSTSGIVPLLSTAAGTERGVFEYDIPGTVTFNISASGRTYGSVVLARSAGVATYGALGSSAWTIRGDLTLRLGVSLASTMTGALRLGGDLVNESNPLSLPAGQSVVFEASGIQRVRGSAGLTILGTSSVQPSAVVAVVGVPLINNGTMTISGALRIDDNGLVHGTGVYAYAPSGTVIFNTAAPVVVAQLRYWPAPAGVPNVVIQGAGGIDFAEPRTIDGSLRVAGPLTGSETLTINGELILAGGVMSLVPAYGPASVLRYQVQGPVAAEWGEGASPGSGVPQDVVIDTPGDISMPSTPRTVPGALRILQGSLTLNPLAGDLRVGGNLEIGGQFITGANTVVFTGGATQNVTGATILTLPLMRLEKSAGSVRLQSNVNVIGSAGVALTFDGTQDVVELNGYSLSLGGSISGSNLAGALSGTSSSGLTLTGTGPAGTLRFAGGSGALGAFTVDRTGSGGGVVLDADLVVHSALVLSSGVVNTGSHVLEARPTATVTRNSGHIHGNLKKHVLPGSHAWSFELGAGGLYSPLELSAGTVVTPGAITVSAVSGDHPALEGAGIDPQKSVNRHWLVSGDGAAFDAFDVTLHYQAGDLDPGANPINLAIVSKPPSGWTTTNSSMGPLVLTASDLTEVGDLAIGELVPRALSVSFTGNGVVDADPPGNTHLHGTLVQLTAVPDPGNHLVGWTGSASGVANPLSVLMNADKNITAVFGRDSFPLTVNVVGQGSVSSMPNLPAHEIGTTVQLTAVNAIGWVFVGWTGDATSFSNPLNVAMTSARSVTATFELDGPRYWRGLGDGTSWADGANWNRGTPPEADDEVILNNLYTAGGFTVTLPAGETTVAVRKFSITTSGGNQITLRLPATNTADPGFVVGDSLAGSDDLLIFPGGRVENLSGASSGRGIQVRSLADDRVRLYNGGQYLHGTLRSPSGVVAQLSTASGTDRGEFIYQVPAGGTYAISASDRTYGSLILRAAAGTQTYSMAGVLPLTVRGDFHIDPGVTALSSLMSEIRLGGDFVHDGAAMSFASPMVFQATGTQRVRGTASITLDDTVTVSTATTLAIAGAFESSSAVRVLGTLRIVDGGSFAAGGTYEYSSGSRLVFSTTSPWTVSGADYWPATSGPPVVSIEGGGVVMNLTRTVSDSLLVDAAVLGTGTIIVPGVLDLLAGGSLSTSPQYGPASTLRYAAPRAVGNEWVFGGITGVGVPFHVVIDVGAGVVQLPTALRWVTGDLSVVSGTLALAQLEGDLVLFGNAAISGGINTSGHAVILAGPGEQVVSGAAAISVDYLRLIKSSGSVRLAANVSATGTAGPSIEFNGTQDILDLNGGTLTIVGTIGGSNPSGVLRGSASSALVIAGPGDGGSLRFDPAFAELSSLTLNRTGAGAGINLASTLVVHGDLSLVAGALRTGIHALATGAGATVQRVAGWVEGNLRKAVPAGPSTVAFEVGSGGNYAPVTLEFSSVTVPGTLTASTIGTEHPNLAGSGIDGTRSVNRHWRLTPQAVAFTACDATFGFPAADVDVAAVPATFVVRKFDTPTWSAPVTGARTATSTQAIGLTSFSDFAVGTLLQYTLAATTPGGGSVSKSPDQATYDIGASVSLTATPAPGFQFTGWSGDVTGAVNPTTLVMNGNRTVTATFQAASARLWVGTTAGGDGLSWNDFRNWNGGLVPASTDSVRLDNSTVATNYTVQLPAGAVATTIQRIVLAPSSPRTITFTLPNTNTAAPGLSVGDGAPGTDDIVIQTGGVMRNATGASSAGGVALLSAGNGTVRIAAGGRYVHATTRPSTTVSSRLIADAGTTNGEFLYDVPGTASFAFDASGRNYGNLTLTRSAGAATYTSSGASELRVAGNLRIETGVTWTSTMTGQLRLGGNLTNTGAALTLPLTQTLTLDGSGVKTLSGTAAFTAAGAVSVPAGVTLAISGVTFNSNGTTTINGALRLDPSGTASGTGSYVYGASSDLIFNNTVLLTISSLSSYWPSSSGPPNVQVLGSGGISLSNNRTVSGLLTVAARITSANRLTLTGTMQMNAGAVMASAPVYSGTPTLVYNSGFSVGGEWTSGTSVGSGVPRNVTVQAGTVTLPTTDRTVPGNLVVSAGTLAMNATSGTLTIGGSATVTGTFTSNGRTLVFNGSATQNLSSSGTLNLDYLRLSKTGGLLQLGTNVNLNGTGANPALEFAGTTDVLDLNGRALSIAGTIGGADTAGTLRGTTTSSLLITGAGAAGTVKFGTGFQNLGTLSVSRTGAAGGLILGRNVIVHSALGLTTGVIQTGTNTLEVVAGAGVLRTSGFVNGNLKKSVAAGATKITFEVGTGTVYSPAEIVFSSVSTAGALTGAAIAGDHPSLTGSGLNTSRSVNRYWRITNSGVVFSNYSATLNFAASDIDAGSDPNKFAVRKYDSGVWSMTTTGTRTATSTQATGMTSFSEFAIGEIQQYTLNATTLGNGGVAKSPDQVLYDAGTIVALTATPTAGHSFTGWTGDASGTTNPLSVTMNANKNIVANFTFGLTTSVVGSGSVIRTPNQTTYAPGTVVTLRASAAVGYRFVSWSGDTTGTDTLMVLTMNANKSLTATFAIKTYALTVNTVGNGMVSSNPNQATYDHGTVVQLTATPGPGQAFVGWTGDATGTTNPINVTMDRAKTVTATFTYTLTIQTVGSGNVVKSPNQSQYAPGTVVTLTATPTTGWTFTGWSGSITGTTNPVNVTMSSDLNITATFTINSYVLTTAVSGGAGSLSRNPDQPTYTHGSVVSLTATPVPGHVFLGWSGDASGASNPLSVTMDRAKSITARITCTLGVTTVGSGTVNRSPDLSSYAPGSTVSLTAVPASGWNFTAWSGDTTATTNPLPLPMNRDRAVTATFVLNQYALSVPITGGGTVQKNPNLALYDHGTHVTLTATPNAGWQFSGWSGDASGSENPLPVTMDGARVIGATFELNQYALIIDVVGAGQVARNPDQGLYNHGTNVTLTAQPMVGAYFVAWSGALTGSTNPTTLAMTSDRLVTATFATLQYPLDVAVVGSGSVSRSPDQATYAHGTLVTLTATPSPGWEFVAWSGAVAGGTSPAMVTMDAAKSVTATFQIRTYALITQVSGNGLIARNPDLALYDHGSVVQLTAVPGTGWHFVAWSGDTATVANPVAVTMTAAKSVTATFEINAYALGVTVIGGGTVGGSPDQPLYDHGTLVTLTATPAQGWNFSGWSGDTTTVANPVAVTMTSAKSVTATFVLNTYALTVSAAGNGSVGKSPDQALYDHGTVVTLTATAATGWHFVNWSGDTATVANPVAVTMTAAKSVTANFAIDQYALSVSVTGGGFVGRSPDQPLYDHGTVVTLTATPAQGWNFSGWSGDTTTVVNPVAVTMTSAKSVTATFVLNTYALTVSAAGNGSVGKSPDQALYDHGTVVTLTATAATGWHFVNWSGDTATVANPVAVTMTAAKSVTANFEIDQYALSVSVTGGGFVGRSPDQPLYDHGTLVTLTATPAQGWNFSGWSGDTTTVVNPVAVTMTSAKSVTATFVLNTYALTVSAAGNGSVGKSPDQALYDHGTVVTLTATAATGWHFVNWSGDTATVANPVAVTMTAAKSVTANFEINQYALGVTVIGGGTVGGSPDQPLYDHGTVVTLTATPAQGWNFSGWSGDTTTVANPVAVTMTSAKSVTANFAINTYVLETAVVGAGTVLRDPDLGVYPHGTIVKLTAQPGAGEVFAGWVGDTTSTDNPLSLTMTGARSVTAMFSDVTPPTVRVQSPNGGDTLVAGTRVELVWQASDERGVTGVDVELLRFGVGGPVDTLATVLPDSGHFSWIVTGPSCAAALLRIVARDAAGNASSDVSDSTFVIRVDVLDVGDDAAQVFSLLPPSPNPAYGSLRIAFTLPRPSRVKLTAHDVQGRVVEVLADGEREAGRHELRWNRTGSIQPGVYFIRLESDLGRRLRRVVVR